jgi:hypothetical protein
VLSTMTPLGERARGGVWATTALAYVVGSILGGSAMGFCLGLVGKALQLSPSVPLGLFVLLVAALADLRVKQRQGTIALSPRRQVDDNSIHRMKGWAYGFWFGLQLGAGAFTRIRHYMLFAVGALIVLDGRPAMGLVVGAMFGLARSAPIVSVARVRTIRDIARIDQTAELSERVLTAWYPPVIAAFSATWLIAFLVR